jgi:hypothetical protein
MSNSPEFSPDLREDPELFARDQVLQIGESLISLVESRGEFGFSKNWQAQPIIAEDDHAVIGAVFEEEDLKSDFLNRVEIMRDGEAALKINWTTIRPNANTSTAYWERSRVSREASSHPVESEWSDIPGSDDDRTIHDLYNRIALLQIRTNLPPKEPRQSLWKLVFGRAVAE